MIFVLKVQSNFTYFVYCAWVIAYRYHYQLPPENLNHTCGGADAWADVTGSSEVFCSAGSYCPTTTQKIPCSSGY